MKTRSNILTSLALLVSTAVLIGWSPLDVLYFTNSELQTNGLRAPMYPDSGKRIRSNDTLLFLGGYNYYSRYYSAQDTYLVVGEGRPTFENEIQLGVDSLHMNGDLRTIRANANPFITDGHGRHMSWIKLKGEGGIDIFQYPLGGARQESLIRSLGVPNWQSIFVDGDCEVEGTLSGSLSIGCSGNMWLLDNVRYTYSNRNTGDFDENDRRIGMLTLASERNIIIKDTYRNGKENGRDVAGADWNRHSIVITAAIYCPNGSFTFEHQNDDWDGYQGPSPDERGWVYLKGCLFQNQRGVLHSPNHAGTGYGTAFRYDSRFENRAPIGLEDNRDVILNGRLGRVELDTSHVYYVGVADVDELTILPEHRIYFHSTSHLTVRRTLNILGSEGSPAHLQTSLYQDDNGELIFAGRGRNSVRIENGIIDAGISVVLASDTVSISNSTIHSNLELSGNISLRGSIFHSEVTLNRPGKGAIERNLFFDQLSTRNYGWELSILNNTFIEERNAAILLESGEGVEIVNNIIYGGREGIVCEGLVPPSVGYNLVYGFQRQAYFGCQPGEGALETDPLFVDDRAGDYRLRQGSPCIDAGDPASPPDPDGTVADLGAYWLDRGLGNADGDGDGEDNPPCPPFNRRGGLPLSASPNPFNATTVIRYQSASSAQSADRLAIYNLSGQVVFSTNALLHSSTTALSWDATAYPAGIYIVRVGSGKEAKTMKIVKVN